MYSGRIGYGAHLPYALGERAPERANDLLSGVTPTGHGNYLGNFFDDLSKIAKTVGATSDELSQVASGQKKIGTFPTNQASLVIPVPGSPVATTIPLLPLLIGAAALLYFGLSGRRRR